MNKLTLFLLFFLCLPASAAENCPDWLNHTLKKLHSTADVNLCEVIDNRPILLVNTASYCGYTGQFGDLQSLHERYKEKGLVIIGFPSHNFRQEAKDEKTTASVCYENFGVEFTMVAPVDVKGDEAHEIFQYLAENSKAPSWNFNKYLVSADGKTITHFRSNVAPTGKIMTESIDRLVMEL